MTHPFFTKEKIRHFQISDRHVEDTINQAETRLRQGYPIDIQAREKKEEQLTLPDQLVQGVVSRFTLDSATEILSGMMCSLPAGLNYPPGNLSARPSSQPYRTGCFGKEETRGETGYQ